jgi:hypothetical protein
MSAFPIEMDVIHFWDTVTIGSRERRALDQKQQDRSKFAQVPAAFFGSLHVAPEAAWPGRREVAAAVGRARARQRAVGRGVALASAGAPARLRRATSTAVAPPGGGEWKSGSCSSGTAPTACSPCSTPWFRRAGESWLRRSPVCCTPTLIL